MNNNIKKNIIRTAITAVISQVCSVLTALLLPRLLIETLGSEYNGLISSARQFSTYLGLVDTGLYAATCYQFIKAFETRDRSQVLDLFATVGHFYKKVSYFVGLLVAIISFGYSRFVSTNIPATITAYIFFAYTLGTIIAYYSFFKYNIMLFASGKQYYITLVCALSTIVTLIGQYILLSRDASVLLVVSIHPIAVILRLLLLKRKALRDHNYLHVRHGRVRPALIAQKWDALVMNISDSMKTFAPIMSISLIWGAAYVSVYTIYESILHLGSSILVTCLNGLTPSLGKGLNKLTRESYGQFQRVCNVVMMIAGVICTCFATMIMSFIDIYIGDAGDISYYYPSLAYLLILSVWFLMARTGYEMLIKALGLIGELRKGAVYEIMIAIVSCPLLGVLLGFEYLALGVVLSSAYRTIRMMRFCAKKIYGFPDNRIILSFISWGCATICICTIGTSCIPVVHTLRAFIFWAVWVGMISLVLYSLIFVFMEKRRVKRCLG